MNPNAHQKEEHIEKRVFNRHLNDPNYGREIPKKTLYKMYVTEKMTTRKIAEELGFKTKKSICDRLKKYGIPLRPSYALEQSDETKQVLSKKIKRIWEENHDERLEKCCKQFQNQKGENHPLWKGGVTREWARKVATDHYAMVCMRCGATEKELIIHHKDGDKTNNKVENLKVLCLSCHVKEHGRFTKEWLKIHKRVSANG